MRAHRRTLPKLTDRLALGRSPLRISPVCLGLVRDEDAACDAFDAGINFFFISADMHWPLYETARRSLKKLLSRRKGIRDEIVVAVASYCTQPEFCTLPFSEVLEAMPRLGRIDLAIAGGAYSSEILGRLPVYREHREKSFVGIRAIGASFHDRAAALQAIDHELFDIAFIRYNVAHPGAREDLFPAQRRDSSTPVFNFTSTWGYVSPERATELGLSAKHWRPQMTDHYRFALSRPQVHGLLCALKDRRQIVALEKALEAGPLEESEENYLINLSRLDKGKAELDTRR